MSLLDRYDGLVVDLDGVVFRAEEPIEPAIEFLQRTTIPMVFVTNNAARRPADWVEMLADAGYEVDAERILTSPMATVRLLGEPPPRVYPVGEKGLFAVLDDGGVPMTDGWQDAEAVVVGWDRELTWEKLRVATLAIHHGARFVGTNGDLTYPGPDGPWPGNGAAIAALRAATGVEPELAGKPETPLFELAAERLGADRIVVIGDTVATDIRGATRMDWDSVLSMSGLGSWEPLVDPELAPTWVVAHLGEVDGPRPTRTRSAEEDDLSAVRELTERHGAPDPPDDGEQIVVAEAADGDLVAAVSWERLDGDAVLRLVVHEEDRDDAGAHALAVTLAALRRADVSTVYHVGGGEVLDRLGFESGEDDLPDGLGEPEAERPVLRRRLSHPDQ